MSVQEPRDALTRLIAIFEAHFDTAVTGAGPDSPGMLAIEAELRDAFFTYDDLLFTRYDVELPFDMLEDEDEDDEYANFSGEENDFDDDFEQEELEDDEIDEDDLGDDELDEEDDLGDEDED